MPSIGIISPRISDSARALGSALSAQVRRLDSPNLSTRRVDSLINWGSASSRAGHSVLPSRHVLNRPSAVQRACNKLSAFTAWQQLDNFPTLTFTTNRATASRWLITDATSKVYCRTTLRGHSGVGIVIARGPGEIVDAPLYTMGIDIHHEFRFHVLNGVVFDGVRKAFSSDVPEEERNTDIMNHAAGTIFVRTGPALERASSNTAMMADASRAVSSLGLDFGAVDVLTDRQGNHYIIEVNTACGLEGTTLDRYVRAFTEHLSNTPLTPWSMSEFAGQPVDSNPSEILNTLQQEATPMNISQAVVGNVVNFTPSRSSIGSLTNGNTYTITRVGLEVIYVRNDNGRIQGYQAGHFTLAEVVSNGTPSVAVEFVGPSDGNIDTSNPPTSPNRIVLLSDGSSVNVTGDAVFTGESRRVTRGSLVNIIDMWRGMDSHDVFLGVQVENDIYRFTAEQFESGVPCLDDVANEHTIAPTGPRSLDIENRLLRDGDHVMVMTGAGGHGLSVGSLATITSRSEDRVSLTVRGSSSTTRIQPNRIKRITQTEYDRIISEEAALATQGTTSFSLDGNTYRVPSRDLTELAQVLRRFTV
jgi:hypothetical protein